MAIVFTRMKHETKRIALKLEKAAGIMAGYLNGNMSQNARNTMLDRFRSGELHYLIATDVAARGLHIDGLTHVIHYAVPTVVETYIHRSGRTGRAGASAETIIFVTPEAESDFKAICRNVEFSEILGSRLGLPDRTPQDGLGGGSRPSSRGRGDRRPDRAAEPRAGGDAGRGRGASEGPREGSRRPRTAPATGEQPRPQGERTRSSSDAPRLAADNPRSAAPKPRVAGEPLRGGQGPRQGGDQGRSGQAPRQGGDQARSAQGPRQGGEQPRAGQAPRPAGERSRPSGDNPRGAGDQARTPNEGRGPKPAAQPSPPIARNNPDSMNSTWDRAYPGRQRGS
ncbi:MAG: hypothetical protein H7338_09585 [Candidatus Sericytochromatia bacterium]|nr:hypothetical protein [Candidatus Sericytochromatia bacterium]